MAATAAAARPISPCTDVYLYDYRYVNDLHTTIYLVYIYLCIYTCVMHAKVLSSELCKEAWQHLEFILIHFVRNYLKFLRDDYFNIYTKYIRINSLA